MNTLILIFIILIIFLFLIFTITPSKRKKLKEIELLQQEIDYFNNDIASLKQAHSTIKQFDNKTSFTQTTNKALDLYEQSNIRLPSDILEELSINHFYSLDETIDFIENQRSHWKLENTKKLHRR